MVLPPWSPIVTLCLLSGTFPFAKARPFVRGPATLFRDVAFEREDGPPPPGLALFQMPNGSPPSPLSSGKNMWGLAAWPRKGQAYRPPRESDPPSDDVNPWHFYFGVFLVVAFAMVFCAVANNRAASKPKNRDNSDMVTDIAIDSTASKSSRLPTHFHALTSAILWRHLHSHALVLHLVRIALPVVFLMLLPLMRSGLETKFKETLENMLQFGHASLTAEDLMDAILGYVLSVMMVYLVSLCMIFFVWHISAEYQSGFRYLLHVSGLSRPAYMLATVGVDGFVQAMLGLVVMMLVAGSVLQMRMVVWSSPMLLLFLAVLLSVSAVTTGCIIHFLCGKYAGMISQLAMVIIIFVAPLKPMTSVLPVTWLDLAFPVISSYRGLFELVAGCTKGRCLVWSDVAEAVSNGNWASPRTMVFGSSVEYDMTPPESLVSFVGLVLVQLVLGCIIIIILDMCRHPALHTSEGQSDDGQTEGQVLAARELVHYYGWQFGGRRNEEGRILNGVSFNIAPGGMLGLLGPNGAGKTTLIRCVTGEEAACEGTITINSAVAGAVSDAYIGLCPQETIINTDLTVSENLLFFAYVRGARSQQAMACVERLLTATNLVDKRDWIPSTLSGGMRRRLAVGCAMIATPTVTILDEPTTGLDPLSRRGIWSTISEIKAAGGCCLLTTHMLEEAEALCSNLVILKKGITVAKGTVQQLKKEWGDGYMLSVDSHPGEENKVKEFIASLLIGEDRSPIKTTAGQMTFKVSIDDEALGHLIIAIAKGKAQHGVRHWGLSQSSLEDTYLRIVQ